MDKIRITIEAVKNSDIFLDAYLPPDITIDIEETNPLFNDGSSFSASFGLPIEPNRHIVGSSDDMRGDSVYTRLHKHRFRLYYDDGSFSSKPVFSGIIMLDDEVSLDGDDVEIELRGSQKEWNEMLEGVNAQDVEIYEEGGKNNIQIGYCTDEKADIGLYGNVSQTIYTLAGWATPKTEEDVDLGIVSQYLPKLCFSSGVSVIGSEGPTNFVNTSLPYPDKEYCNIRLCTQRQILNDGNWKNARGYHILEPERVSSAPCFYVMFWIERLLGHLNVRLVSNGLTSEPDFMRLAFVNSYPKFEKGNETGFVPPLEVTWDKDNYTYIYKITPDFSLTIGVPLGQSAKLFPQESDVLGVSIVPAYSYNSFMTSATQVSIEPKGIRDISFEMHKAYATAENFPNVEASEIISSLESAFGARFLYDSIKGELNIVLLRDVLKQNSSVNLDAVYGEVYKQEFNLDGVRIKYKSANEIRRNVFTKQMKYTQGGDETTFNYYDFRKVVDSGDYATIMSNINPYDDKLYIFPSTGNAYRIKVDQDATSASKLYPSLFQVMTFHDVEIGNCDYDATVEEISIGFNPVVENDVNYENEYKAKINGGDLPSPIYAIYADAEMHTKLDSNNEPEIVEDESPVKFEYAVYTGPCYKDWRWHNSADPDITNQSAVVNISVGLKALDSFDISNVQHPLETVDFGFTLGILRDSSERGGLEAYDYNYDGMGHSKWRVMSTSKGDFTSDSMNDYGEILCSHSEGEEIKKEDITPGGEGDAPIKDKTGKIGISLKLQAEKYNPDTKSYYSISGEGAKRGLYDRFLVDYVYFLLHRKMAVIEVLSISKSVLFDLDWTKKYTILEYTGIINKRSYSLTNDGIRNISLELYYL